MKSVNKIGTTDYLRSELSYFSEVSKEEAISLLNEGKKVFKVYTGMVNKHHSLIELRNGEPMISQSNAFRDWHEKAFAFSDTKITIGVAE